MNDLIQVQKDYDTQGPWGYQHALWRPRTKTKGCQAQTKGEEKDLLPRWEKMNEDG